MKNLKINKKFLFFYLKLNIILLSFIRTYIYSILIKILKTSKINLSSKYIDILLTYFQLIKIIYHFTLKYFIV